jgi:hypothetical protein
MKKRFMVVLLALVLCLGATPAFADESWDEYQNDEIVWKTGPAGAWNWYTIVGEVHTKIDRTANTVTVTYVAHEGFKFAETHLAVAGSLDGIPHTKGGPTPGKFAFGDEWKPFVSEVTYVADITGIPRDEVHVVAHAVVVRESDGMTETGWATGCFEPYFDYPGKNWARWYRAWDPGVAN